MKAEDERVATLKCEECGHEVQIKVVHGSGRIVAKMKCWRCGHEQTHEFDIPIS